MAVPRTQPRRRAESGFGWRRLCEVLCSICCVTLALLPLCVPAVHAQPHRGKGVPGPAHFNLLFPRIANYNGLQTPADVPAFLEDGLIVAPQQAQHAVADLRAANPDARILVYQRTLQVDYPYIQQLYGSQTIFPGWWLLRAGSRLAGPISASQTSIPVLDSSRFQRYDDVLVGAETMHVLAIEGQDLIVQRGFYSTAAPHVAGAHIAAHYSYRVDLRNSVLSGPYENRRPWSFNLSSACPKDSHGRTWADFLTAMLAHAVAAGGWSGIFFDNTDQFVRDPWVDVNNDNVPDGGVLKGRNVWKQGELYLLHRMHALAPHALLMYNGTLDAGLAANGREFEGFPLQNGLYMPAMSDYLYWERHDGSPAMDIVNPDTARSPRPVLAVMRFGLTSALMGNGYFSYDEGWHKHGVVWNFDEYDNGAGTTLLRDAAAADQTLTVRRPYRFRAGDIVLIGREQLRVRAVGAAALIVTRGVNGTTPSSHPASSVVATLAQIERGLGYLGLPEGPPRALLRAPHGPNLLHNRWVAHEGSLFLPAWLASGARIRLSADTTYSSLPARPPHRRIAAAAVASAQPLSFRFNVRWSVLRRADAITLQDTVSALQPHTSYTLSFSARGVPGTTLPVLFTGWRGGGQTRYATKYVTLHRGWYQYVLPYTTPGGVRRVELSFLLGRTPGVSGLSHVQLQSGQALVFERRFSQGIVLVNQGDYGQTISLPRTYWHLRGDQDPAVNNGLPVRRVVLLPHSGVILLKSPPPA